MSQMRKWDSENVFSHSGWRRLGTIAEFTLGQELDRDEDKLIRDYKPKLKRVEE